MTTTTLRFLLPVCELSRAYVLMEADDTPECELRVKTPARGGIPLREIEIATGEANACYFKKLLNGRQIIDD